MKIAIILLLLTIGSNCFGQSYTERYNEIQERYDYYDSYNQLVGYKKWDEINREWKYTDLTQQRQQRKSPYANIKPINTFNSDLAYEVLATKQRRYDANVNRIQLKINELRNNLSDSENIKIFDQSIIDLHNENPNLDYSSSQVSTSVINYFIQTYNALIKPSFSGRETNLREHKTNINLNNLKRARIRYSGKINLKAEANYDSQTLLTVTSNDVIYIINESQRNKYYMKVVVRNTEGFVITKLIELE